MENEEDKHEPTELSLELWNLINKEDKHEPTELSFELLKKITEDFTEDRKIGAGGYGIVYKGTLKGKEVAVKKLHISSELHDEEFNKEFESLTRLQHINIVRLLGFCSEEEVELAEFSGKNIATTRTHRALCSEYVVNGNLEEYISEEHNGFNWSTCYNIIKGICEGLKYLGEETEKPIWHLDLKPSNILLDDNMTPKISDFGLSKLFGQDTTRKAINPVGTCGYWPPEYIKHQIISKEFDIYSLGVIIIKTMTGHDGYQHIADMTNQEFLNHVYGNWRRRLHRTMSSRSVEVYSNQVKACIELAMDCMRLNRQERPTIQDIVSSLNKIETMISDQGLQNEQYYRDGDSTQPSRITSITIDSRPSSSTPTCRDSSIGTPRPADDSTFSGSSTENKAHHEPNRLPYQLIKRITNDFHKDRILGRGGFGTVYKGEHENGEEIAIKVLHSTTGLDDTEFRKEFNNLKRLNHQNVVELVGYCSEEEEELVEIHGNQVSAVRIHLALCFEYVHNGSLEKYISDESMQFDWPTRYTIINGICEGLKYLHGKLIVHCDLKPGNILLDKNKMAKIADFGLAKLFGEENTKRTMSSLGTCGYQPPEFIDRQIISKEFDIYSLGVIIVKIMTGHEGYNSGLGTLTPNSVKLVYESWMKKLPKTANKKLYGTQVKTCILIAIDCLKTNRHERPTIGEIVSRLKKQYHRYEGESTHCSRINIDSGPSSGHGEASSIATHTENFWGVEPRVYMTPQHGSCLDRYISDTSSGLGWRTRYRIKKGICDGVKQLHEGSSSPIIHMNLKTSNILLDERMMPKLGDYVMSRFTGEENVTMGMTMSMTGTIEHMPPEFIEKQVITKEFDIYSLGVIFVKVMTGERLYSEHSHMSSTEFIELAHGKWRDRLQETMCVKSAEGYCRQVRKCLEVAFKCMEADRRKRPAIGDIIRTLSETETMIPPEQINLDHPMELLIDVQPLELCFQFMSSLKLPRKKDISCSLQLNNRGNDRVAFMLVANNPKIFLTKKPLCGVVSQKSTYTLTLIMPKQPQSSCGDDFFTLHTVAVGGYDLREVNKGSIANEYGNYFKKAKETACQEVQEVILKVLCCQEDSDQGISSAEPTPLAVEIIATPDAQQVSSIDMHPEEPWIMTTSRVGRLQVWDYRTMTPLNSFELGAYEPVHAAKFIARVKWLLAGDSSGGIHVYSYDQNKHVKSFDAHDSRITTLAVHPTRPFILSSSSEDDDHLIKLWDWGNGWKCTQIFQGHTDRVTQVTFNPEDENSFASASWDGTVKIWSICSDDPNEVITLNLDRYAVESLLCVDYFTRRERQHLIIGCRNKTAQIWKLGIKGCVHEVEGHADRITAVNLHPMLPVLITASLDGTVCIWNSNTYKLENTIAFNLGAVYALGFIKGSTRIMVGCDQGIATMEISPP